MSEIGSCLAFLCCCGSDDPSGSGGGKTKPDPRERMVDDEFLARNYRQDSSGRFHTQPTPTSSMLPTATASRPHLGDRDQSRSRSSASRSTAAGPGVGANSGIVEALEKQDQSRPTEVVAGHLQPPQLVFRDSESTAVDTNLDLEEAKAKADVKADPQIQPAES